MISIPRKARVVSGLVAAAATSLMITASPAHAVTCYGDYCSGLDPQASGCYADAYSVASSSNAGVTVQLMWSPTCQTNWARVNTSAPAWIKAVQSGGYTQWGTYSGGGYAWSRQIYSPSLCVTASVQLNSGAQVWTSCR